MDPVSAFGLKVAGSYALGRVSAAVRAALSRNTDAIIEAYKREGEEWRLRRLLYLDQQYARLEEHVEDLKAHLDAMFADRQFVRLYDGIEAQALMEALDERRDMLAALAAGIIDPRLTLEERVDVERVVRTLSPTDVMTLYALSRVRGRTDADGTRASDTNELRTRVLERSGRKGKLAQCLDDRIDGGGGYGGGGASRTYWINKLGREVLQVLHCYVAAKQVPFAIPGRDELPPEQVEAAWTVVEEFQGLKAFLDWARGEKTQRRRIGMQYSLPAQAEPTININVFSPEIFGTVADLNGVTKATVTVRIGAQDEEGFFVVFLDGPDQVLRVVADHVDADFLF